MSKKRKKSFWSHIVGMIRKQFLSGLVIVVPIFASVLLLVWSFNTVDDILQPIIEKLFGMRITGLGFGIILATIFIVGIFASNFVGRKLIQMGESILRRIPLFKLIYSSTKQVMDGISGTSSVNRTAFREVVLVEFPANAYIPAFITNEYVAQNGKKYYTIYIPTTPTPWSGYASIVAEDKITRIDISIDEALKMCLSGMMISPSEIQIIEAGGKSHINLVQKHKSNEEASPMR
ncbi:MAG: DUF502 domain-containing protein [Dehalococcoidia bacterium]|nr:DUF502 domain-containing protein [Dehalococcoidia bacterium]